MTMIFEKSEGEDGDEGSGEEDLDDGDGDSDSSASSTQRRASALLFHHQHYRQHREIVVNEDNGEDTIDRLAREAYESESDRNNSDSDIIAKRICLLQNSAVRNSTGRRISNNRQSNTANKESCPVVSDEDGIVVDGVVNMDRYRSFYYAKSQRPQQLQKEEEEEGAKHEQDDKEVEKEEEEKLPTRVSDLIRRYDRR